MFEKFASNWKCFFFVVLNDSKFHSFENLGG